MEQELEQYILHHIDNEGQLLSQLNRDTHVNLLRPRMLSGHLQGRILKMICRMISPVRILELGTFTGYSALCMAEALPDNGELHTIEIDDELETFILKYFDRSPYRDRIHLHIGDAREVVPQLDGPFDMVFIDANKRLYCDYYDLVFDKVRPGGFILADNTLWDGKILQPPLPSDAQTIGIMRFNEKIAADTRVEKVILPLRDGLTLIYKK
ncbi:MAG TPA: O-methyltransferase [Candidatus Gallibacteroides avistercoris]|uniref:O-methyltransferase n=1 Tax=Candidatus Gallibacteroides avistercoris TaxID=2840833 RepID=A0A9D1M775_9BACT|nr:O-methyltransferase [Candidatus Gallibacteroides avistercoris]